MATKTHASKSELPATDVAGIMEQRSVEWNGYQVSFVTMKQAVDQTMFTPLFEGLPDNLCPVPHWGYLFKGKIILKYKDREETINAGDAFYCEAGHVPLLIEEGSEYLEFSPKAEMDKMMAIVATNMEKMMKQQPE